MNEAVTNSRTALGRYEIVGEIARGAMGVVYKARDPMIDRIVAIKTVTLGLSDAETEAFERRFFREAKSAGRLNHPNVVTIHDVGKTDDVAYIAMEYLDGRSLRDIMDSGVVLPPQRIAGIAAEIAEGLAFAHRNQVIHRDVKPANIMVLASGAVKITDFGIALLPTGTRTLAGNVFGSPRYTSPEQVMGRPVDGRSDIFSLGAVLYEMLTGKPPFQGNDLNSILRQVLSDPTPPPSSHNPKLPRAFDHVVGKALAKDPDDRYQDAQEMASDLRRFDSIEFQTSAPAPLPALEHPTSPQPASATALASAADEEQVPLAAAPSMFPESSPPWWRNWRMIGATATAVVLAAVVAALALREPEVAAVPVTAQPPAPEVTGSAAAPAPAPAQPAAAPAPAPVAAPDKTDTTAAKAAAPAAAPEKTDVAAATPAPPKPTGRVLFAVSPWGEIVVDGRKRGVSPPMHELKLPPGKHVIEVRNTTFPPHRETIDVAPDGVARIKHKFQ
ncbi:MAG: serine/threonine protein kinase [Burkholderiales bacterium]|nr:serine/threonine protein kinase [Burkholderiales bacterium]